ncbi:hypothetical protein PV326_001655 [Microctonus aethiopoides]|nr:hypothetical protein PV326_001655 [Microctonus aethiopoides]
MCTSLSALYQINMINSCVRQLGGRIKCGRLNNNRNMIKRLFVTADSNFIDHRNKILYGSAAIASSTLPGVLSKQQAKDLAVRLTSDERDVLISALQECQSQQTKAEYEGQLAAFRWRSKFGRPTSVPSLGQVDPTGSYCTVPDDWLLRKYASSKGSMIWWKFLEYCSNK